MTEWIRQGYPCGFNASRISIGEHRYLWQQRIITVIHGPTDIRMDEARTRGPGRVSLISNLLYNHHLFHPLYAPFPKDTVVGFVWDALQRL